MAKEIWIIEGIGDNNPEKHTLRPGETIGQLKRRYASKLGVSPSEIEISTDTQRLTSEGAKVDSYVEQGDTIHILPRAKGG